MPVMIIFDVDRTLTRSKLPANSEMVKALSELLATKRVGIISGDSLSILKRDIVSLLPVESDFGNLFLLPTSGAALYVWKQEDWHEVYAEILTGEDTSKIGGMIRSACEETGLIDLSAPSYGERIEYRGAQVTLSALGQQAPIEEKEKWDPNGSKKRALRDAIARLLPEYDVKTGGSTSVDVTRHGVNKAYGIRRLSEHLSIPISEMLYVGDALYPEGNDEVVGETGIATRQVSGPDETLQIISEYSNG
ncbi:hypothetical protein A3G63_02995 [Candidatus Kaiserbacteria bacterium RIFCSPLOWO2_12_FULL_52_8]|uniref:phosphomannomutase n=1 Tax=Candidatus Kaiserbacteria bacterium RIFCSPHIGHO2_01_FULL_53_31 TaxID=1798481 RepID=A0A1F6CIQ7_9BACT|nr:MAG: hypothetical protein A2678_01310 [Candidatus Kaiserbacteria bacterium RIFCSPHIGHO2_01_FULL_53_31]OGG94579.1 MAG: hypothetical protein A3G63_02995 [Candidatus Kaiserbacteria bacterium RIFCSPLOWO2_12_FULL_52_8]